MLFLFFFFFFCFVLFSVFCTKEFVNTINTGFLWLAMALNEFEGDQTCTGWSWMQILTLNPAFSKLNPRLQPASSGNAWREGFCDVV